MHCCNHQWFHKIFEAIGYQGFEIILGALLVSVFGSFIHCIGMCGPIASARYSMRLMSAESNPSKFKLSIDYSYYLGKILSYLCISSSMYFVSVKLQELDTAKYLIFLCLCIISTIFLALSLNFSFFANFTSKSIPYSKIFAKFTKKFNIASGFVLGFIPCGYLYAVLSMIALKAESYFVVLLIILAVSVWPFL